MLNLYRPGVVRNHLFFQSLLDIFTFALLKIMLDFFIGLCPRSSLMNLDSVVLCGSIVKQI